MVRDETSEFQKITKIRKENKSQLSYTHNLLLDRSSSLWLQYQTFARQLCRFSHEGHGKGPARKWISLN